MTLLDTARALQELSGKATQGPWKLDGRDVLGRNFAGGYSGICHASGGSPESADANAELIAMFGTHGPALVAALLKAHEALKQIAKETDKNRPSVHRVASEAICLMESPL